DNKTRAIYLMEAESNFYNEGVDTGFQNLFVVGGNNNGNNASNDNGSNTISGKDVPANSSSFSKTINGQFTVPPNTNTAILQFLTTPNPHTNTNSTYLINNLDIISASENPPVFISDFDRRNVTAPTPQVNTDASQPALHTSAPVESTTKSNWENYHPEILSTSLEPRPNTNHTLGTLGNNTLGNTTIVNNTIGNATAVDKSLKVSIKQGTFSYWGVISTDFIPAFENTNYNFSMNVSAESVTQLHSKVL